MSHRIEVGFKTGVTDGLGNKMKQSIARDLGIMVDSVRTVDIYHIDRLLSSAQITFLGNELFADPIIQDFCYDRSLITDYDWVIEVGFKPGVTDNVGKTAVRAIEDILKIKFTPGEAVYTSRQYLIYGKNLKNDDMENIAHNLLANEQVQHWLISPSSAPAAERYLAIPRVNIPHKPVASPINLDVSDAELVAISKKRSLALNLKEMCAVREYFSRSDIVAQRRKVGLDKRPTDAELEALAQTWSEHCKHKIFSAVVTYKDDTGKERKINNLFATYIKGSTGQLQKELDWVVSTLWDNSGVMKFNQDYLFCFKCETHNSPSNEEPYGGALTGIVGVYRDPMGTGRGSKLIYGTYGFCTGSPFYQGDLRPKLHPRRLLEGVRKGVEDGGNKHGVPTPYGLTFFDDGYIGKPAIYVLAAGIIPNVVHGEAGYTKKADPGDLIVMCGGKVGIDGIHGATESSLEAGEWISASHVQIGDPFTQKKMHDFLNEARDLNLYKCVTDNGAGGLSSSVGEMAQFTNGFEMYLDKVPLKYAGLAPWQILVSESQERMSLAVSPDRMEELFKLAKKHDVETTILGKFTDTGKFHCLYEDKTVTYMDMEFAHHGVPQMSLEAEWRSPEQRGLKEPRLAEITNHTAFLKKILARPNICSKEYIVRQFDHEVQGTSVIKPLVGKENDVNSDAVVVRPDLRSNAGIAISAGINPKYSIIDTYDMTACAFDEAIRRVIAVGANMKQIALNDNFCWPSPLPVENNPDAKYKMAQLIRANEALKDYSLAFKTPCISGKDSMSMDGTVKDAQGEDRRISALPTVQFSAAAKVDDINKCVTMDIKEPGDIVYLLGETKDELGGSEYYEMREKIGRNVPRVDAAASLKLYNALAQTIDAGLVTAVHGCYKGGLGVALAQMAFAGNLGLTIDLRRVPTNLKRTDKVLYSESAGRFVVTIAPDNKERFLKIMQGNVLAQIGVVVSGNRLNITGMNGKVVINESNRALKKAWQSTFGG